MSGTTAVNVANSETWEWIDPDGVITTMNKASALMVGQVQGAGTPPPLRAAVRAPGAARTLVLNRIHRERLIGMQAMFVGASPPDIEAAIAAWASLLNPLRGSGQLRHTRSDGTKRRILYCEYDSGLDIDQSRGIWRQGAQGVVIGFYAGDPYWYEDADTTVPFTTAAGGSFFPIPNAGTGSFITLVSSTVFGNTTINNSGDVDIYPVWTITGPGSSIVLRNTTTGKVVDFSNNGGLTLTAGQVLTVNCKPGSTLVQLADATNEAAYLTDASELWPLVRGNNVIQVEMSGSTGASAVSLAYRKGYLTT